jgi:RNA recognition motif-containing protein
MLLGLTHSINLLRQIYRAETNAFRIPSESVAIPVNPRTNRPVGYAFVDLATAHETQDAIQQLSGKEILERKVSVQVARKPEPAEAKEGAVSGGEGASGGEGRKRGLNRGRGRGRGRGGRFARGGRRTEAVCSFAMTYNTYLSSNSDHFHSKTASLRLLCPPTFLARPSL